MLNLGKLYDVDPPESKVAIYHKEVARHLVPLIGDHLSLAESIALMQILHWNSLEFNDGFIINDSREPDKEMWLADAAVIAAAFCTEVDKDWRFFKRENPAYPKESHEYVATYERLLNQIRTSPNVRFL